jgi:hypothetical protein
LSDVADASRTSKNEQRAEAPGGETNLGMLARQAHMCHPLAVPVQHVNGVHNSSKMTWKLIHQRLVHPGVAAMKMMQKYDMLTDLKKLGDCDFTREQCLEECGAGKMPKPLFLQ